MQEHLKLKRFFINQYFLLASPAGCEPAREEVSASQKLNALPTELSGRPSDDESADLCRSQAIPSLEYRRERADMIQVYKILNDIDIRFSPMNLRTF